MSASQPTRKFLHGKVEDLRGRKFGEWSPVEFVRLDERSRSAIWLCVCSCGFQKQMESRNFVYGQTLCCRDCRLKERGSVLEGQVFGRLTVVKYLGTQHGREYLCTCSCGMSVTVLGYSLTSGNTTSCGCYKQERILAGTRGKVKRHNLTGIRFGRLVVQSFVCVNENRSPIWSCVCDCGNSVDAQAYVLKNGSVKSCGCLGAEAIGDRATTHGLTSRKHRMIEWNGIVKSVAEWADYLGIGVHVIFYRINKGWPVDRVLGDPVRSYGRYHKFKD